MIGRDADDLLQFVPAEKVAVFSSMRSFDLWRRQIEDGPDRGTIAMDVEAALSDMGYRIESLEDELRAALKQLLRRTTVPFVRDILPVGMSERTFYRRWRSSFRETPKQFLLRVRLSHVRRLMDGGLPPKEAAWRAGFASAWHLRQSLN